MDDGGADEHGPSNAAKYLDADSRRHSEETFHRQQRQMVTEMTYQEIMIEDRGRKKRSGAG